MDRHSLNIVDGPGFIQADDYNVQADMTQQIIDYVEAEMLTVTSAAKLFNLQESILARVVKGEIGVLSDDELGDIVNLILARQF